MPYGPSKAALPAAGDALPPLFAPVRRLSPLQALARLFGFIGGPRPGLPPLAPLQRIERPVSVPEYYHASVGYSGTTLEVTRENGFCIEARGRLSAVQWREALERVAAVNPGVRLRLRGDGRKAIWDSNGQGPRLRIISHCEWDGRSDRGSEIVYETPLRLDTGPTVELVVIEQQDERNLVVLRSHHAVMDGMGCMHFLHELFRALRGEALLGTNAAFSDVDLMRAVGTRKSTSRHIKTVSVTGAPHGDDRGDEWRRVTIGRTGKNPLQRVADAVTQFTHAHTDLPVLIGVPVDLRRHVPDLRSTANYTNMLFVRVNKGEGAEQFRQRLREMLDARMEAMYPRILEVVRWFPLVRLDRMLSRNEKNYRSKKPLETVVVSNLGRQPSAPLSCEGFTTERMFLIPIKGSAFITMIGVDDHVELAINLPRVLAGEGRFDALVAHLRASLIDASPAAAA